MSLAKFLVNTVIIGAVAGGVYHYLDQNAKANAANADDPDMAPTALDPENIKDAANRAYTTIQHGTEDVADNFKKAIGPQGEEILNNVSDAAVKIKDTAVDTGKRLGDIVADEDSDAATKATAAYDAVLGAATDLKDKLAKNNESIVDVAAKVVDEVKADVEQTVASVEDELKDAVPASDEAAATDSVVVTPAETTAEAASETVADVAADAVSDAPKAAEEIPTVEVVTAEVPDADKIEEFFDEDDQ